MTASDLDCCLDTQVDGTALPQGGQVRLSIGPYAHEIDLYAPEPRAGFHEYRWSGQRWERHDLPCEHG
jgi:hypothetical protein